MKDSQVEILLVEDNQNDAELTIRALQKYKMGNTIKHVKDGEEALDFLFTRENSLDSISEYHPRLILLDIKLPKVSGLEVLSKIRENQQTRHIPVVILTSSNEEKDLVESYKLGVNSYITKPVDFNNFIEAVSDLGYYWLLLNKQPYTD
jgi:CheY-like chemotaxis protein